MGAMITALERITDYLRFASCQVGMAEAVAINRRSHQRIVAGHALWEYPGMTTRVYFATGFLASVAALGFAYLLQYVAGLDPCPLCIFQRIAMAGVGLFCLVGLLHGAGSVGHRIYALLASLAALAGAAIAARHVWLMHIPPDQVPACGPGLHYLLQVLPWREVMATVLRGDASCATVKGSFAGISLPEWSLIYFLLLSVAGLAGVFGLGARRAQRASH
jgi:disulfide bond formation protein DsbB